MFDVEFHVTISAMMRIGRREIKLMAGVSANAALFCEQAIFNRFEHIGSLPQRFIVAFRGWWCHRSLENQPRKVEMNQPLTLHRRSEHFHYKKLLSRALQGVFCNENVNLRKMAGWFISTLTGRFVVTADTGGRFANILGVRHSVSLAGWGSFLIVLTRLVPFD